MKFVQIKDGGPNFWGNQFCWKSEFFGPLLYFNFKSFVDPKSLSLVRFQCALHDSGIIFSDSANFYKLERGGPIFWGEPILQKVLIIWSPFLYFRFKSCRHPNISSFIRFQCILLDSGVSFSVFWNFFKLKRGDLISRGRQFCRKNELFGPPFCISILKVLLTQRLCNSSDLNTCCMIDKYLSQRHKSSTN